MEQVVRFSLNQRVFYNLAFVLLMVAGVFALGDIPVERYPGVNFGEVLIQTYSPGASPADVEALVTTKVEEALEEVDEVEWIQSSSYRERSVVHVKFTDDSDYDALFDDVRFAVLGAMDELPEDIDPPEFTTLRIQDFIPVIVVNLAGERSNRALTLMAEELKGDLRRIPGVREVRLQGEYEREFHVLLDPARMAALGVSFEDVAGALEGANVSLPAGDFANPSGEFVVKVDERYRSRDQVMASVVRRDADGSFVRVRDVAADARMAYRDPFVISSVNGASSVALQVLKTDAGNALDTAARVKASVEAARGHLAREGVEVILTQDSTTYIGESVSTLGWNMALGIVLVSLIVWYFMGTRNAGITTIGIPFSFLVTMLIVYLTGNSLNEITLFAFVLVTGIVVDDAIVVVENIYRHTQEGMEIQRAIVQGTAEVALPVIAATSTTVAAFLPMLIMTGSTGEFFAQIPKAVTFAIVASLVECLLILPIHFLDFGPRPAHGAQPGAADASRVEHHDNLLMRIARAITERLIRVTLRFRKLSLLTVVAAFAAAMVVLGLSVSGRVPLIRIQFFPDDYNLYYVDLEAPASTPIEAVDARLREIAAFLLADGPGMAQSAAGFAGFYINEDYQQVYGNHLGTVMVQLPRRSDQRFADYPTNDPLAHLDWVRERVKARFGDGGHRLRVHAQKDGPPTGKDVNVRVLGSDFDAITRLADALLEYMRTDPAIAPYLVDLEDDRGRPNRVFRFAVRQDRTHEHDLDNRAVAGLAASVLDGRYVGKYRVADEEVDLKLRIDPAHLDNPTDALGVPVLEHPAGPLRLGDLTRAQAYTEPGSLKRYQGERAVSLLANLKPGAPTSIPAVLKRVQDHYAAIRGDYPGAHLTFGGSNEDTRRSYASLTYAFGIAVLIMYLILATQFHSYVQPLIILSAVVFALIGVVFGKLVTQSLFTVNSFIAIVGVTGVVVNDALVLIDFINRRYRAGMSRREAIAEGIRVRLRPILLTTLTTTLGLLPMALGIPSYSLVWGTMASTFVTGLATATFLTLFIVPVQWDLLEGARLRLQAWRARRAAGSPAREARQ